MITSKEWLKYEGKKVRLVIIDGKHLRPRDGIFIDCDSTHIFLQINDDEPPKPFLKTSIKRVDLQR